MNVPLVVHDDLIQVVVETNAAIVPVVISSPLSIPMVVGIQGPKGSDAVPPDTFLEISRRLGEFNTPQAKAEARMNLELQYIDGGSF